MEADRAFDRTTAERGVEGWVSFFADDGAMIQAGVGEIRGLEEIRRSMAGAFQGRSLRWGPLRADVSSSGDLGYTVGTYEARGPAGPEGEPQVARGMYVSIWKKQSDGRWKVVMDLGNPVELPPPPREAGNPGG
jgi:ketosteroid isomerase-like protein